METNKNIEQLLEMLDHPEAYSEQEIMDIVNRDHETRETYRQLVQAKQASNHHRSVNTPVDVDEAWRQFEQRHLPKPKRERFWLKIAALLAGIVLMSGVAWATVYIVHHAHDEKAESETTTDIQTGSVATPSSEPALNDTITTATMEPIVFDNVPLDQILTEIASYYGMSVEIRNDEARDLRFHFVWNKNDGLDKVLENLGHFDRVNIEHTDNTLIVH